MQPVEIYTAPHCGLCRRAKGLLEELDIDFREISVEDDAMREEMVRRTGQRSVPQIFVGERHVGGFQELSELESSGRLDDMLRSGS